MAWRGSSSCTFESLGQVGGEALLDELAVAFPEELGEGLRARLPRFGAGRNRQRPRRGSPERLVVAEAQELADETHGLRLVLVGGAT